MEKGASVNLANNVLLLILSFLFSFFFQFLIFLFFFNVKNGGTPLYIAAQNAHKQVVQLLLEKGKPNVDFANQVILLIVSFFFLFFHFLIFFIF